MTTSRLEIVWGAASGWLAAGAWQAQVQGVAELAQLHEEFVGVGESGHA